MRSQDNKSIDVKRKNLPEFQEMEKIMSHNVPLQKRQCTSRNLRFVKPAKKKSFTVPCSIEKNSGSHTEELDRSASFLFCRNVLAVAKKRLLLSFIACFSDLRCFFHYCSEARCCFF